MGCRPQYYIEQIEQANSALENLDAIELRAKKIATIEADIKYHASEYDKEIKIVNEANAWVTTLLSAL